MNDLSKIDDPETLSLVQRRWFQGRPSVGIAIRAEGVEHDHDRSIITLGCRAGPSYEVGNLLHEMAHLIEIPEERAVERNFGFKFGTAFISSIGVQRHALTYQATMREARVWSWQFMLMRELGLKSDIDDLVRSASWISDFENVPGNGSTEKLTFIADVVLKGSRSLMIDMFDAAWNQRVTRLPELFQERKERFERMEAAFAGECVRELRYQLAETGASHCAKLLTWSNGKVVAHEVFVELENGVIDGAFVTFDHAAADRYARRLFGGLALTVSELRSAQAADLDASEPAMSM